FTKCTKVQTEAPKNMKDSFADFINEYIVKVNHRWVVAPDPDIYDEYNNIVRGKARWEIFWGIFWIKILASLKQNIAMILSPKIVKNARLFSKNNTYNIIDTPGLNQPTSVKLIRQSIYNNFKIKEIRTIIFVI
ncbi:11547_t:CDS:2, partial [Racocetra persica]